MDQDQIRTLDSTEPATSGEDRSGEAQYLRLPAFSSPDCCGDRCPSYLFPRAAQRAAHRPGTSPVARRTPRAAHRAHVRGQPRAWPRGATRTDTRGQACTRPRCAARRREARRRAAKGHEKLLNSRAGTSLRQPLAGYSVSGPGRACTTERRKTPTTCGSCSITCE